MGMRRPRYNMGRIDWIGAEALGVPGQRTFRLLVLAEAAAAQLWLEKEQLQRLAEAIAKMIMEIEAERGTQSRREPPGGSEPKPPNFPASPDIDFQVGTLALRYDPDRDLIALEASERDEPDDEATLRCLATRRQMESLEMNSIEVVAAGRPRCP